MAQVTGAVSASDAKIEVSTDGSSWTNVSGMANTVTMTGGGRTTGETYTFDGDGPIVTSGKSQPFEITLGGVYTEGASDLFNLAYTPWKNGTDFYVRWSPKGGQTGEKVYTTGAGRITALTFPNGDAASGAPIMTGVTWRGAAPTISTAA